MIEFFSRFSLQKKKQRLISTQYFILLYYFAIIFSGMNRIPVIHNVSLQMLNYNSTTINGTCNECLCTMLLNITLIFSFNCFQNNKTCEIFSKSLNTNSFLLINNTASSVYFISLPTNDLTLAMTSTTQNTSELLLLYYSRNKS
jgi:hypothetical protein